jgi:hypothetical protein
MPVHQVHLYEKNARSRKAPAIKQNDLYQQVTDKIIAALERARLRGADHGVLHSMFMAMRCLLTPPPVVITVV